MTEIIKAKIFLDLIINEFKLEKINDNHISFEDDNYFDNKMLLEIKKRKIRIMLIKEIKKLEQIIQKLEIKKNKTDEFIEYLKETFNLDKNKILKVQEYLKELKLE